jgi:predicted ribosome quality control (RQC) complex YloA/Tae2 family protein
MKEEQFHFNGVNYSMRVGRNSKENDELVKTSAKTDIWFHVDGARSKYPPKVDTRGATARSSAHVILINTERLNAIPKQVIKRCACLCKSHSSSKSESKCGIVYTALANVLPTEIEGRVTINEMRKIIFI